MTDKFTQSLNNLDKEIDLSLDAFKHGFWLGFIIGLALSGIITWSVMVYG